MINPRSNPIKAISADEKRPGPVKFKRHNHFVYLALTAALLVSLAQSGCTGLTSANATDPATATTIAVSGASGIFGNVGTGSTASQTFLISNTGKNPLTITRIAVTGTGYTITGITLPMTVPVGASMPIVARFAPTTAGVLPGNISITANTNPSVTGIALSGTGTTAGQPVISVTPSGIAYGGVGVGQNVGQLVAITNVGTGPLTISSISAVGSGFSISGITSPITLDPGKNTFFTVNVNPTITGNFSGTMTVANNSASSSIVVPLSATGMSQSQGPPAISVNPTSFDFGNIAVGATSSHAVTISNTGSSALSVSNISASGAGFSVSGFSLPISIPANQSTTITASFVPTSVGAVGGSITMTNNSATPSMIVPLNGTGTGQGQPAISVAPANFDFGNVAVGASTTHTFTISNSGGAALNISNISAAGPGFSVSGFSLPISVAANQSTTITAKFVPTTVGAVGGSITISNNSSTPSVVVPLNGTGASAGQPLISANPNSVSFGNVTIGAPNSQTIILQNNGTATLTISQATVSGTGFSMSGLAVPATIAAGGNTTFNVAFGPAGAGAVTGSVSLLSNAPGSPTAIPLSGTGVAVTKLLGGSTTGVAFGNVAVGSNSSQNITLSNNGNSTVTVGSVSVTGAGYSSSGVVAGQAIGAGQSATLSVSFAPASALTVAGNVTVTSDATNSPINVSLSGTGTQVVAHSVSLTWTASTSSVVGYNVYRSTTSGGPYTLITSSPVAGTTFADTSVQAGVTYYFVVTAVDATGNESVNSNEVSATIPTP